MKAALADYARAYDLSSKTLYGYKTRFRRREEAGESSTGFVKVIAPATPPSPVTVSLPNGVRLTLPGLDLPELLERLARL